MIYISLGKYLALSCSILCSSGIFQYLFYTIRPKLGAVQDFEVNIWEEKGWVQIDHCSQTAALQVIQGCLVVVYRETDI